MNLYDSKGKSIGLGQSVGRGGEATVYRVQSQSNQLAKIYEPAPRPNYPQKLTWMVNHPPEDPTRSLAHPSLAWPSDLLYDSRRLVGYLMPYIQAAVPIVDVFNPRRRALTLPTFDRRYLHRTARNLAAALGALHKYGYVAGDINESNVLVTPTALVTLIDTDSFQVNEERQNRQVTHYCPVAKLEYTPPELQKTPLGEFVRLPAHDDFALGVLIFQLLMEGSHPFRAQWLGGGDPPPLEVRIAQGDFPYNPPPHSKVRPPKNVYGLYLLHPEVSELVRSCFSDGHRDPALRPAPAEWEKALSLAENALVQCSKGHYFSNHLASCPICPLKVQSISTRPKPARPAPEPRTAPARKASPPPRSSAPSSPARWSSRKATPAPASNRWATYQKSGSSAAARTWRSQPSPPAWNWPRGPSSARPWPNMWTFNRPPAAIPPGQVWNWARPRLSKSILVGGGLGALIGMLPGAVAGAASWSAGNVITWSLLWALGGASAGILRGWKPGYRLSLWVNRRIGWHRVMQGVGLLLGALGGALAGFIVGWWAVIPVFLGLYYGGKKGLVIGRHLWLAGNRLGWERIWAVLGAASAAFIGWNIANWVGGSGVGSLAGSYGQDLAVWLADSSTSWLLAWAVVGALGGALGGAIGGTLADLFARFSGLVD